MKTRVLSGVIMLPLLAFVAVGGRLLMFGCFLVGVMGVREFYKGFNAMGVRPCAPVAYLAAAALYACTVFFPFGRWYMLWFTACIVACLLYLFKIDERKLEDAMATLIGIFYVVFLSWHVTLAEQHANYGILVWLIFITAFGTDIMAYFSGYALGKHKLCPKISPKKTIEGSVGGTLGSIILCTVFGYFVVPELIVHCAVIGVLGGIISQFGDLSASIFKRKMGIKDYGNLIPGHGGVLDRFDSVLFTAPMVYYYIVLILD
ncbi:MAG: phosphatidate cytidylyltransferase [Clostridia bacterium]|nr:phosphatidate cytidylyltransferase [Clostridia bacterium]